MASNLDKEEIIECRKMFINDLRKLDADIKMAKMKLKIAKMKKL
jgi:UDP-N-acetylglucosamine enolpyruvyl transferase